ncbi:hypothetical protein FKG96_17915 [Olivibacter sp. LS-1]|jgi:hypothetical protein|uniref:hypothetical protein n=1 Tax=Olivibacter sp. LS-1 TaxID=2592345 RepID=UPI0011EAFCCF|nr:hypothetical protein [Olivibacter sp. LS-1]QEL02614.1 hypothetical protein FKG96_17915 [Olivibacter sp. LS-1]
MATLNSTLEDIMKLDYTSREMILEILQKRQIESRRELMAKNAKKSLKEYRSGKTQPMSLEETLNRLHSL